MDFSQLSCINLYTELAKSLPACWQRKRGSFRPVQVLYSIMTMTVAGTHGYRAVIDHLKRSVGGLLGWEGEIPPYPSSLSDARRKLSAEQCLEAFSTIRKQCSLFGTKPKVSYGDFRLLAVDMTTLALPAYASIQKAFGSPVNRIGGPGKAPKATLTALWDISMNAPLDWRLERCYASERFAAYDLIRQMGKHDLLIADRGYPSYRMLCELRDSGASYLIRLPTGTRGGFSAAHLFAQNESAWDEVVLIHESHPARGEPTMPVRLIKKRLDSGAVAVFVTNLLSGKEHSRSALCDIYCHRWDIETAFREMKVWHGLEDFHARYAEGIHQEVAALMIFMLLTAELEHQARVHHNVQTKEHPKGAAEEPEIRFNRKQIGECIGYLLIAAAKGPDELLAEYTYCMNTLWRFRQKRRPGRKFERIAKSPNSKWKRTTYNTKKNYGSLAE